VPEAWVAAARAARRGDRPVAAEDGVLVAPVHSPAGSVSGALAVRPAAGRADAMAAGARHLALLLASSEAHTERSTAYEALFEIGTQIQAEEVHADAIFALIVERARDLLRTDVSWLAMVDVPAQRVRMKVAVGTTTPDFMAMEVRVGTGIGGRALKEQRPVAVHDSSIYGNGMPRSVHRALDDEGVTSILCAPMLRDDGMLGALYVGTRTTRHFTEEESSLLAALAAQAAVAIENARLYQELAQKHEALERAFAIHRQLTDTSLAGVGLQRLALELARLVDRDLVLTLAGSPRCARYPRHPSAAGPVPIAAEAPELDGRDPDLEIVAGDSVLGALHVLGREPLSPIERKALEHGATVIALELVKEQAALEVEWRLQGELLEELLRSEEPLPEGLRLRAERFGVALDLPHRVAVLRPQREASASALLDVVRRGLRSRGHRDGLVAQRGERVLVALRDADGADDVRRLLEELQRSARLAGVPFTGGLSSARADLAGALREAEGALAMAISSSGGRRDLLAGYEDLGPLRFLLDAPDTVQMRAMVCDVLGPLAEHDARRHSDLLRTLRAYLECGGHHATTAERCHIHISTLKYRLSRIAVILDRPLADPAARFELRLALEVLSVLEAVGSAPFATERPASGG
jgi:DNA-binding PucR family transcriptional regulator